MVSRNLDASPNASPNAKTKSNTKTKLYGRTNFTSEALEFSPYSCTLLDQSNIQIDKNRTFVCLQWTNDVCSTAETI